MGSPCLSPLFTVLLCFSVSFCSEKEGLPAPASSLSDFSELSNLPLPSEFKSIPPFDPPDTNLVIDLKKINDLIPDEAAAKQSNVDESVLPVNAAPSKTALTDGAEPKPFKGIHPEVAAVHQEPEPFKGTLPEAAAVHQESEPFKGIPPEAAAVHQESEPFDGILPEAAAVHQEPEPFDGILPEAAAVHQEPAGIEVSPPKSAPVHQEPAGFKVSPPEAAAAHGEPFDSDSVFPKTAAVHQEPTVLDQALPEAAAVHQEPTALDQAVPEAAAVHQESSSLEQALPEAAAVHQEPASSLPKASAVKAEPWIEAPELPLLPSAPDVKNPVEGYASTSTPAPFTGLPIVKNLDQILDPSRVQAEVEKDQGRPNDSPDHDDPYHGPDHVGNAPDQDDPYHSANHKSEEKKIDYNALGEIASNKVKESALDDKLGAELYSIVKQIKEMQKEVAEALQDGGY